jgi:uncharacterized protein (DUF169 family)
MLKFEKHVLRLVEALNLQSTPVGAKFSRVPKGKEVDRKLRICEAINAVRRENVTVNLSKENCTCRVGCHIAGWQMLSPEEIPAVFFDSGAYASKEIAEASVGKQPPPRYRGKYLIIGPLSKFETDPDVVLFFVNPAQADRILGLASYKGAEPFMCYPVTTTCSAITFALAKGKPDVNFISVFERQRGEWFPNELVLTLPLKDFLVAVKSISRSRFGEFETGKS